MEHIRLRDEHPPDLAERMVVALNWLSEVPPPSKDLMGPIGGGLIHHSFFKNNRLWCDVLYKIQKPKTIKNLVIAVEN
jgi:hypothetical protein